MVSLVSQLRLLFRYHFNYPWEALIELLSVSLVFIALGVSAVSFCVVSQTWKLLSLGKNSCGSGLVLGQTNCLTTSSSGP